MTQEQRLDTLLDYFIADSEQPGLARPSTLAQKQGLLRGLTNIRPAKEVPQHILALQDEYLQGEKLQRGVVKLVDIEPIEPASSLYLWQGDITCLDVGAIVNAVNSALLGCFIPCHGCIDNAIHSAAGVQLRLACADIMRKQGESERTGGAKITPGFNLPAKYVLHTVGPIIQESLTDRDCELLASCYSSCLTLAHLYKLESIAFCCISTGEFHFPRQRAAEIAVETVNNFLSKHNRAMRVVFNVFKDEDRSLYENLLGAAKG